MNYIFVFRSNIETERDRFSIADRLNKCPCITDWNVDLDDDERILRVCSEQHDSGYIVKIVAECGYQCEELPD